MNSIRTVKGHLLKQSWIDSTRQELKLEIGTEEGIVEVYLDNVEVPISFSPVPKMPADNFEQLINSYKPEELLKEKFDPVVIGTSYTDNLLVTPDLGKSEAKSENKMQEENEYNTSEYLTKEVLGEYE